MDIWQNLTLGRSGILSPFSSKHQGVVAQLFQTPVIWVSTPTSFLTMPFNSGLVTASFGAGRNHTRIGDSSEQPWGLPGSPF